MHQKEIRNRAIYLRSKGKTFTEIRKDLGEQIPKATLFYWLQGLSLTKSAELRITEFKKAELLRSQSLAVISLKNKREKYLHDIFERNKHLANLLDDVNVSKIVLATLYLGEGTKNPKRGALVFGNSDPTVIKFFLNLLRKCFDIDESKMRCTVQCRSDQNIPALERFWSKTTGVPLSQFYKARIDPRSIGQITRKKDYKGVCRIDYFSADVFQNLLKIINIITLGR